MKFRFQSFVDINTSASSMQVIQWSVGGKEVFTRCRHLFGAYKYFKLGKISVKLVPASTLPVDPQGLSYDLDDPQTVDPRDQMNPGLVRITNGEDIFTDVSSLTDDQQRGVYNTMMLDPRWSKFMLQSGFRRSAYPLYWQVGQLSQDKYPGSTLNVPYRASPLVPEVDGTIAMHGYKTSAVDGNNLAFRNEAESSARGLFQVGHRGRLGYLPTDYFQEVPTTTPSGGSARYQPEAGVNNIPEVQVITCVLPKAYKTLYYYRAFITEEVIFSGLRSAPAEYDGNMYLGLDTFNISQTPIIGAPPGQPYPAVGPMFQNNGDELP